ncbi:hypothetical protein PCANB_002996 [Pneumocystis canis]|nr:hypothetical protein PCK1_003012 [Pneumocystis canis]KAG5438145.1 hypothetical protein PCANB_002996 [Pneumocystis canis]
MKIHNITTLIIFFYISFINSRFLIYKKNIFSKSLLISYCKFTNPANYLFKLNSLEITPNPPIQGKNVTIKISGTLKEDILIGSYDILKVKYEFLQLFNHREDLCTQVKKINLKCPIEKGNIYLKKMFFIPQGIFPGRYVVSSDIMTEKNQRIACFSIDIVFKSQAIINTNF